MYGVLMKKWDPEWCAGSTGEVRKMRRVKLRQMFHNIIDETRRKEYPMGIRKMKIFKVIFNSFKGGLKNENTFRLHYGKRK